MPAPPAAHPQSRSHAYAAARAAACCALCRHGQLRLCGRIARTGVLSGRIPGVGAIYNGQYAKGIVHAVIWGLLMSMADSRAARGLEPVFVILVAVWWFYMAFEAYHTARKRRAGEAGGRILQHPQPYRRTQPRPGGGITLIGLGALLLLHTLDLLDFEYVARFWPVLLIAAGAYLSGGPLPAKGGQP